MLALEIFENSQFLRPTVQVDEISSDEGCLDGPEQLPIVENMNVGANFFCTLFGSLHAHRAKLVDFLRVENEEVSVESGTDRTLLPRDPENPGRILRHRPRELG